MEDMVNFTCKFVKKVIPHDTLTGFLKNSSRKNEKSISSPKSYFFITELCSPMDSYIKRNFSVKESIESRKRINTGNKIHKFAENWFQEINGFESSESILDGIYFGLPVRGKIDARIGDSIIELKTEDKIPENKEEAIKNHPQDVEQLCFYTCIDPLKPRVNYLVFISHENPAKVKAFKVEINDFNKIKFVLKSRIDEFSKALEEKDPSKLGRCRYCGEVCKIEGDEKCQWFNLPRKECEVLDFINISEDKEFGDKIKEIMTSWDGFQDTLSVHNLIAPRRYLCQQVLGEVDEYEESSDKVRNKDYVKKMAYEFRNSSIPPASFKVPRGNFREMFFSKNGWIHHKSSQNPEGENIPFIAYSSEGTSDSNLKEPAKYKIAELGIIVSNFNMTKGIIIAYFPNVGDEKYKVFEVDYSFDDSFKSKINSIIEILKSGDINKLNQLPKCPWYFHKDGKPSTCCSKLN